MDMRNYTPFPNLRFSALDKDGSEFGVLLVKGTYRIDADGTLSIADEQAPLVLTDTYHGASTPRRCGCPPTSCRRSRGPTSS